MTLSFTLIAAYFLVLAPIRHMCEPSTKKHFRNSNPGYNILDTDSVIHDLTRNSLLGLESTTESFDNYPHINVLSGYNTLNAKGKSKYSKSNILQDSLIKEERPNDLNQEKPPRNPILTHLDNVFKPVKDNWCNPLVVPVSARTSTLFYSYALLVFLVLFILHVIISAIISNYGITLDFFKLSNIFGSRNDIPSEGDVKTSQILGDIRIIGYSDSFLGSCSYKFFALILCVSHLIVYYLIANELCLSVESSVDFWNARAAGYIINCILSVLFIAVFYILSGTGGVLFLRVSPLSTCKYVLVGKLSESKNLSLKPNIGYRHFSDSAPSVIFDFERGIFRLLLHLSRQFASRSLANYRFRKIAVEELVEDTPIRRFKYECIHYVYNSTLDIFVDSSESMKTYLNQTDLSDLMTNGGLTESQASERLSKVGFNELHVHLPTFFDIFRRELRDYFFLIQLFVTYKSVYWRNLITAPIWASFVVINIICKSMLVRKRQVEVHHIAKISSSLIVDVLRDNKVKKISSKYLTIGDVVRVEKEWLVPCDMLLLRGTVSMDESSLTGESAPVQKVQLPAPSYKSVIGRPTSMASYFNSPNGEHVLKAGTRVVAIVGSDLSSLETVAVVIATGAYTTRGKQIKGMLFPSQIQLKYDAQLPIVVGLTSLYALGCSLYQASVLGWNMTSVFYGIGTFAQVLPLWTPTIVSIGEYKACERLFKESKIRCTAPSRVAICGKVRVMCFDKTGTITEPGLCFTALYCGENDISKPDIYGVDKLPEIRGSLNCLEMMLLGISVCHSLAPDNTPSGQGVTGLNAEKSMFLATGHRLIIENEQKRIVKLSNGHKIHIIKVFPFCHHSKKSSVLVSLPDFSGNNQAKKYVVFCKGSFEAVAHASGAQPPTDEMRIAAQNFCSQGLYTIALGYKYVSEDVDPVSPRTIARLSQREYVEKDLSFLGLILFRNRVRSDAIYVFNTLRQVRVRPVILTGDDSLTAISVAQQVGIINGPQASNQEDISPKPELVVGRLELHQGKQREPGVVWRFVESNMLIDDFDVYSSDFFNDLIITGDAFDYLITNWEHILSNALSGYSKISDSVSIDSTSIFDWNSMWGGAWRGKNEVSEKIHFEKLLLRIRLFTRLNPDQKKRIVEAYNDLGLITGMCGDGNNDCGALESSHAGISLTEGEASIVSPFTSTASQLSSVIDLIREGRATLVNSLACYKFMLLYGILISMVKIILFKSCGAVMPEWGYLLLDNLIIISLSRAMAGSKSSEQLRIRSPTSSLLGPRTLISAGSMLVVNLIYLFFLFVLLGKYLPSSKEFNAGIPSAAWWKLSDNFEAPVLCIWLCFQVTNAAVVFSFGDVFRETVFYNYKLTFWWACINSLLTALVTLKPSQMGCLFRINCTDEISKKTIFPILKYLSPSCSGMPFYGEHGHNILTDVFKKGFLILNVLNIVTNMLVAKFVVMGQLSVRVKEFAKHRCSADRINI